MHLNSISHFDASNQTFRGKMYVDFYREMTAPEIENYHKDKLNFIPSHTVHIYPWQSSEVHENSPVVFNNNKTFVC